MPTGIVLYDGTRVKPDDTIEKLGYEEEHELDIYETQRGG